VRGVVLSAALLVLALPVVGAVAQTGAAPDAVAVVAPAVPEPTVAPDPAPSGKPTQGVEASFGLTTDRVASAQPLEVPLAVTVTAAFADVTVEVTGTGAVETSGGGPIDPGGGSVPVTLRATGAGEGTVVATVVGTTPAGERASYAAQLYVLDDGRETFLSGAGPLDVELAQIDRRLERGEIDAAAHAAARDAALGGGAAETVASAASEAEVGVEPGAARAAAVAGTVQGLLQWEDRNGGRHPIRNAVVRVFNEAGTQQLGEGSSGGDGRYSIPVTATGRVFIRVYAMGPAGQVGPSATGSAHWIRSGLHDVGATIDLTAREGEGDNHNAFSVYDALTSASAYVGSVHGAPLPPITTVFPAPGSFFDGQALHLLLLDRWDHDVLWHEYGHYVQQRLGTSASPGGQHAVHERLGECPREQVGASCLAGDAALRLAWSEGWASYFAVSGQRSMGLASQGIPGVGDLLYSDTEDLTLSYSLEANSSPVAAGEDGELAVQRVLYDLFDGPGEPNDAVVLGGPVVWSAVDAANAVTLFAAYRALATGRPISQQAAIGCVLSEHGVAPRITSHANGATVPSLAGRPTFTWAANGGGPSHPHTAFEIRVYDGSWSRLLLRATTSATSFQPSAGQWNAVLAGASAELQVVVIGRNDSRASALTARWATGPYTGCGVGVRLAGAPAAEAGGPYVTRPGALVVFDGTRSADTAGGRPGLARFDWDLDGNGTFETTGARPQRAYPSARHGVVTLRVTDRDGLADTDTATLDVIGSDGYLLVEADGEVTAFGDARLVLRAIDSKAVEAVPQGATRSSALVPHMGGARAVAIETTPAGDGFWVLLDDGRLLELGRAQDYPGVDLAALAARGSPPLKPGEVVSTLSALPNGDVWVFTSAGRIIPQRDPLPAAVQRDMAGILALDLDGPVVDSVPTTSSLGAYATASDGGVFTYGDAVFIDSVRGQLLKRFGAPILPHQPVVGIVSDPDGRGYWMVAADGGVFAIAAPFRGSLPAIVPFENLVAPVNGMVAFGSGYLLVAGDGGVFNFAGTPFRGSGFGLVDDPVVGLTAL
jgi:hypothetical protein